MRLLRVNTIMTGTARIITAMLRVLVWMAPVYTVAATPGHAMGGNISTDARVNGNAWEGLRAHQKGYAVVRFETPEDRAGGFHPQSKRPQEKPIPPQKKKVNKKPAKDDATEKEAKTEAKLLKSASGPLAVFADIEAGWKAENIQAILRHFGKGKVSISISGGPSGGRFSRSQSFYLLKDLYKYTITKKFEFVQYRNLTNGKREVFAIAERYYKRTDDGRLFKDKIYVSLHLENDRWVIDEIKSTR